MNSFIPAHPSSLKAPRRDSLPGKSFVHRALLALVAIAIGSGAIVFSEPAPVDALMLGLLVLLPVAGLVTIKPSHIVFVSIWLVIAAAGFAASIVADDPATSTTHTAVSLYLYLSAFLIAIFVAKSPAPHARLVLGAYTVAAVIAAVIGLIGYFDLVPGAGELFTKYGRASGPFKDPNVFGAFLSVATVKLLQDAVSRRGVGSLLAFTGLGLVMFAVLLSFSRGAWAATATGMLIYGYLAFVTAKRNIERVKLLTLALASIATAGLVIAAALQFDEIADLLGERASLSQSYDVGPEGRFGGQEKAKGLILENPLGIGAATFRMAHHTEDVHNVYLSMFLNAGWIGGLLFLAMAAATLIFGLRHAFKRTSTQPYFLVAYAALAATIFEGAIIDIDHWRHFYLLMGLVWGLMIIDRKVVRSARIIADHHPILLNPVLMLPPPRRAARSLVPAHIALPAPHRSATFPSRPARILARLSQPVLPAPAGSMA